MATDFNGKATLVTGAASGIGAAIVTALLEQGANVLGVDLSEAVAIAPADSHDRYVGTVADVTDEANVVSMVQLAIERFGRLDAAFNVAGGARIGSVTGMPESEWTFVTDLCLKSVFLCVKHEAQQMKSGGAIVNITSLNARVPGHGMAAYSAAKAGAEMLSRTAALELAPAGIRVNTILPGLVDTPLSRGFSGIPEAHAAYMARIPMGRAAEPAELAAPALFLASSAASYVSGASLVVDGAWETTGYPDLRPWLGPIGGAAS